ncbi:MAG: putative sulfate/molybdate transporter [Phycisphaeraceae bacterium]
MSHPTLDNPPEAAAVDAPPPPPWLRFDRHELAGSFGDIGTDLPLLIGMILAAGLDPAGVFIMFGLLQIFSGLAYGLPMPMQPLKAMAVIVITQGVTGDVLFGAGLAIGVMMLLLTLSGALQALARLIPPCVVRGLQFGLGLALASLAVRDYIPHLGYEGYALAAAGFTLMIIFQGSRRWPAGLLVIGLGVIYALVFRFDGATVVGGMAWSLPRFEVPGMEAILTGLIVLSLPQLPLSLSNSVIATRQTIADLFPHRRVGVRKIGLTYSLVNLTVPFFGGIPLCHGCGGLAGHYALGARTGGSVLIYGSLFVIVGLLFSPVSTEALAVFPKPILGVVLLFEALILMRFVQDQAGSRKHFMLALLVGVLAFTLPQGFLVGLIVGTGLYYLSEHRDGLGDF